MKKLKQNKMITNECFSNRGLPESVYVDVDNKILLSNQENLLDEPKRSRPVFYEIAYPLYEMATNYENEAFVSKGALGTAKKEELAHFEINISRMFCAWPRNQFDVEDYAKSCLFYEMHLWEARLNLKTKNAAHHLIPILDRRINQQKQKSAVKEKKSNKND